MPGAIVTDALFTVALNGASLHVPAILAEPGATWAGRYVMCVLRDSITGTRVTGRIGDVPETWDPRWGKEYTEEDFLRLAEGKRWLAEVGKGRSGDLSR